MRILPANQLGDGYTRSVVGIVEVRWTTAEEAASKGLARVTVVASSTRTGSASCSRRWSTSNRRAA
jgi:hypothetical protein